MSTQAGEIIVQAFREGNFVPIGHTSTAEELTEALPRLSNIVMALFGNELGEDLRDWPIGDTWPNAQEQHHPLTPTTPEVTSTTPWAYPPQNSRLLVSITTPKTIYFPPAPTDGARMALVSIGATGNMTLHGNGRLIAGATTTGAVAISTLTAKQWFYRADLGDWKLIEPINGNTDLLILPEEFDDFFVTGLAMRLTARFQATALDASIPARNEDMLKRIVSRYKESSKPKSAHELRALARLTAQ